MLIDTGALPETHPVRQGARKRKVSEPRLWVLSKAPDPFDCEYLFDFVYATDPKTGKLQQWLCSRVENDSLEELIREARKHGLKGIHGIV